MHIPTHTLKTQKNLHTWAGILCALFLIICFLSGALALYADTIDRWATPPQPVHHATPDNSAAHIRAVLAVHPEAAASLTLHYADHAPAPISWTDKTGDEHWATLDGDALHTHHYPHNPLGAQANLLHQTAGIPGTIGGESLGLLIMGIIAVLYTLALVSGTILYLPTLIADLFALRSDKSPRRAWLDTHNLLGLTGLPFHLIIAATTAVFAYHDLIYDGMDNLLPPEQHMKNHHAPPPVASREKANLDRLILPPALIKTARQQRPDLTITRITYRGLDNPQRAGAVLLGNIQNESRPARLVINPYSGDIRYNSLKNDGYTPIINTFFHLHLGDYGGALIRAAYLILALMGAALFYTGNLLWLDKRPARGTFARTRIRMAALSTGITLGSINGIALAFLAARSLRHLPLAPAITNTAAYYTAFLASAAYALWHARISAQTEERASAHRPHDASPAAETAGENPNPVEAEPASGQTKNVILSRLPPPHGNAHAAIRLTRCAAWLTLAIPTTSLLGAARIPPYYLRTDTLGVDITALILGFALHHIARVSTHRLARARKDSVWYSAPKERPPSGTNTGST